MRQHTPRGRALVARKEEITCDLASCQAKVIMTGDGGVPVKPPPRAGWPKAKAPASANSQQWIIVMAPAMGRLEFCSIDHAVSALEGAEVSA